MKVFGFFRGFPGLGRVMSGTYLLSALKEKGYEVKAYSYLQGAGALKSHGIDCLLDEAPSNYQIMPIGLNPVGEISGKLIDLICQEKPDLVIVDGEPLFISTLATVYPKEKILALLNPADLYNSDIPESAINFFHTHYLSAGSAIVHGFDKNQIKLPEDSRGCDIKCTNTILRTEILNIDIKKHNEIAVILGGGSKNSSDSFLNSTILIAKRVVEAAEILSDEQFKIYCNDERIAAAAAQIPHSDNLSITSKYTLPREIYSVAKCVICRAGRNTISEVLYLNLPAVLIASSGDHRSSEQERNIEQARAFNRSRILQYSKEENASVLAQKVSACITAKQTPYCFVPGNDEALDYVLSKLC